LVITSFSPSSALDSSLFNCGQSAFAPVNFSLLITVILHSPLLFKTRDFIKMHFPLYDLLAGSTATPIRAKKQAQCYIVVGGFLLPLCKHQQPFRLCMPNVSSPVTYPKHIMQIIPFFVGRIL